MKLNNLKLVKRVPFISDICKKKTVLNLGCADLTRVERAAKRGEHVHVALTQVAEKVVGVDLDKESLEKLAAIAGFRNLINYDVEKVGDLAGSLGLFDVVVVGELIEHLNNPGQMLAGIRRLLKDDGFLIITTPNSLSLKTFLHCFLRGLDVSSDYHSLFFSFKTLRELLRRHGYLPVEWKVAQWSHPGWRNRLARPFGKLLFRVFPQVADTIICVAKISGEETKSVPQ